MKKKYTTAIRWLILSIPSTFLSFFVEEKNAFIYIDSINKSTNRIQREWEGKLQKTYIFLANMKINKINFLEENFSQCIFWFCMLIIIKTVVEEINTYRDNCLTVYNEVISIRTNNILIVSSVYT